MSGKIDWSKAPDDATHYNTETEGWYKQEVDAYRWDGRKWYFVCADLGQIKFSDNIIERPSTPSWSSEGLPPVGVECEFKSPSSGGWSKARIVFVSGWTIVLYVFFEHDEHCYSVSAFEKGNLKFRQIRTPEQIAADEREAAIDQMVADTQAAHGWTEAFGMLHDKGYRKP